MWIRIHFYGLLYARLEIGDGGAGSAFASALSRSAAQFAHWFCR